MKRKKKAHTSLLPLIGIVFAGILFMTGIVYYLASSQSEIPCANSISCTESMKFKIENNTVAVFNNKKIMPPQIDETQDSDKNVVLGIDASVVQKRIYVDLATQTLTAYEGLNIFMKTPISSGLWGRTPKGEFTIWVKLRSTTMTGGSGDDYYHLPNVPYVMFFSNNEVPASSGFSLHGTYWHNNFGHPMSHGCVNMKTTDIAKLYEWANPVSDGNITHSSTQNPGTKVIIFDSSEK